MKVEYTHNSEYGISVGIYVEDNALYMAASFTNKNIDNFSRPKAIGIIKSRINSLMNGCKNE